MKRFFRSIPRVFARAKKDMRHHFSMVFSSVLSIAAALLLCMIMALMAVTTDHIAQNVESQLEVQVQISPAADENARLQLEQQLKGLDGAAEVIYSSRDQELEHLIEENGSMFEQYRDSNPLYDIFLIRLDDPDQLESLHDQAAALPYAADVSYGGNDVLKLVSVFQSIRLFGWAACAALIVLCLFLIRNTIKMAIMVRQDDISIMRTVGAASGYIITPFLIEGARMGFYGALIPCVLVDAGYIFVYESFGGEVISGMFGLIAPWPLLGWMSAAVLAAGMLLGLLGSWLAAAQYVRRTR